MIELKNVSKHFIDGNKIITALKDISIFFDINEFVLITGPSGSGKSTLINVLAGNEYVTEGEYLFDGISTESLDEKSWEEFRQKNISVIYQDNHLINDYTVEDNIKVVLSLFFSKSEILDKLNDILNKTKLNALKNSKLKYLSGGQKQRVAIACALAKNTKVILADEPTANLDEKSSKEIVELLKTISAGKIVIMVSHNEKAYENVFTRHINIVDGCILSDEKRANGYFLEMGKILNNDLIRKKNLVMFGLFKSIRNMIVIFFTFFFILFASLSLFSIGIDMTMVKEEGYTETEFFANLSKNRYILTKTDQSYFSNEEIEKIKKDSRVDLVVKDDLVLDVLGQVENSVYNSKLQTYIKPLSQVKELSYGRLPSLSSEVILSTEDGLPFSITGNDNPLFTLTLPEDDNPICSITVVGWVKDSDSSRQSIFITDELMDSIYVSEFTKKMNVSINVEEYKFKPVHLFVDDLVPEGRLLSNDENIFGKNGMLVLSNNVYSKKMAFDCSEPLTSYPDLAKKYENIDSLILLNRDEYYRFVLRDYYQLSIFTNTDIDSFYDYNIIYPAAVNLKNDESSRILSVFIWFVICLLLSIVLMIISLVFLKFVLKGDFYLNTLKHSLGYSKNSLLFFSTLRIGIPMVLSCVGIFIFYGIMKILKNNIAMKKIFLLFININIDQLILVVLIIFCIFFGILLSIYNKASNNNKVKKVKHD